MDKAKLLQIQNSLKELEQTDKNSIVVKGLKTAANIIIKQARGNLDENNTKVTGNLSRSFTTKQFKKKAKVHGGFYRTVVTKGFKSKSGIVKGGGGNHAHLVDRMGVNVRYTKKSYTDSLGRVYPAGMSRGIMYKGKSTTTWNNKIYKPHGKPGFWTDAFNSKKDTAMDVVMKSVDKSIRKIMNRNK